MTKWDLQTHSIIDEELSKRAGIESLDEILDHRCMNWMEKVAKMPATLDSDTGQPKKWDYHGKFKLHFSNDLVYDAIAETTSKNSSLERRRVM